MKGMITLIGKKGQTEVVTSILKRCGVSPNFSSVYEENRDTGYPGLCINYTVVELFVGDRAGRTAFETLTEMGFSPSQQ